MPKRAANNVDRSIRRFVAMVLLSAAPSVVLADQAECEATVRATMLDFEHDVPVLHRNTTTMGETTLVNLTLSTGYNRGLAMDADGVPQSLFIDEKFYTTSDGGETWTLVQTYTPEQMADTRAGLEAQAAGASEITCTPDVELDGRAVHYYSAAYVLQSTGMAARVEYWVDTASGFVWRNRQVFDPGGPAEMTIVQDSEEAPGEMLPDPGS